MYNIFPSHYCYYHILISSMINRKHSSILYRKWPDSHVCDPQIKDYLDRLSAESKLNCCTPHIQYVCMYRVWWCEHILSLHTFKKRKNCRCRADLLPVSLSITHAKQVDRGAAHHFASRSDYNKPGNSECAHHALSDTIKHIMVCTVCIGTMTHARAATNEYFS